MRRQTSKSRNLIVTACIHNVFIIFALGIRMFWRRMKGLSAEDLLVYQYIGQAGNLGEQKTPTTLEKMEQLFVHDMCSMPVVTIFKQYQQSE